MARSRGIRWTPTPDRWAPFWCNGNTHRSAHKIDARGWYFLDGKDRLVGPFDNRAIADRDAQAGRLCDQPLDPSAPTMGLQGC